MIKDGYIAQRTQSVLTGLYHNPPDCITIHRIVSQSSGLYHNPADCITISGLYQNERTVSKYRGLINILDSINRRTASVYGGPDQYYRQYQ